MIQAKTKLLIKDNSPLLEANCIHFNKKGAKIGNCIKVVVSKMKPTLSSSKEVLRETSIRRPLHSVLVIQTKALAYRGDGSTVQFGSNSGVSIILKKSGAKKKSYQLGFKRINSIIPFELKNNAYTQKVKIASSVVKLAKHLL